MSLTLRTLARSAFYLLPLPLRPARGRDLLRLMTALEYNDSTGGKLLYRLFTPPPPGNGQRLPLLLCLHGAGGRGDDNQRQLLDANARDANRAALPSIQRRHPCYVLSPQCPTDEKWVDTDWSADSHEMTPEPAAPLLRVTQLLDLLLTTHPIDPHRIYAAGLSMGGYAVWDLLARYPDRFSAAIAVCGGGDPRQAHLIARTPVRAFHGLRDDLVPVSRSREMVTAVAKAGGQVRYTEFPHLAHDCWGEAFADREVWEWLFSHSRA